MDSLSSHQAVVFGRLLLVRLYLPTILFLLVLSSACSQMTGAVDHGWEGVEYENTYLSATSQLGAKALKNWRNFDLDVRKFLEEYRKPDVIYSKRMEVTLYYLDENVQVRFEKPTFGITTKIEQSEIPESLYQMLISVFR